MTLSYRSSSLAVSAEASKLIFLIPDAGRSNLKLETSGVPGFNWISVSRIFAISS